VKLLDAIARKLPAPRLTTRRIALALAVAVAADAAQVALGPVGWFAPDEVIDVIAMVITCWLLGFHVVLLPTFVLEFVPVLGMLPTWTACVTAVVALRRREQQNEAPPPQELSQPRLAGTPPLLPPDEIPKVSEASPARTDERRGERPREPARLSESSSGPADGVDANPS
jgi:hypothetical protein